MNEVKKGVESSEFWMSLIMAFVVAVMGLLVAYGLITAENSELVVQVVGLLVSLVAPLVIGAITTRYTHSRTALKLQAGSGTE